MYTGTETGGRSGILRQRGQCGKDCKQVWSESFQPVFLAEKLFAGEYIDEMQKPEGPITETALEALRAENAALAERVEALRRENQELERTRHRLQLEVDVLKKADESLKKEEGVNPDHLSNREKAVEIDALRKTYRLKE